MPSFKGFRQAAALPWGGLHIFTLTCKRSLLALVVSVYAALGIAYAVYTPTWQTPDEPAHFNYIRHLAQTGALPILNQGDYPHNYLEEIKAIKDVFGQHAYNLKLNAPKSMLGHTCWAAPIVETIGGILQMTHGTLHPSINIEQLDPEVDLDVCANEAQDHQIRMMLKNSFGFVGINCCSLIKKYEE